MRINEITEKKAQVTLTSDDLVCLGNALYFYEEHHETDIDAGEPDAHFHDLCKQIATARDLCQYGHLDGHSLGEIAWHELMARPDGSLKKRLDEMPDTKKKEAEHGH